MNIFGNFENNFIFYGFEDTDLGYKLSHLKFKLNKKPVYHLFHLNSRSEFFNSKFIRNLLLARTAQIFFLLQLDQRIYSQFIDLMSLDFSIYQKIKKLILRFNNKIIGKWPVLKTQKTSL